jgi:hypothetical protein
MDRRGKPPFILNFNNRWTLGAVSLMCWLFNGLGKNPQYRFNRRRGTPPSQFRHFENKISLTRKLNPKSSSSWPIATPASLNIPTLQPLTADITISLSHIHFLQLTSPQSNTLCNCNCNCNLFHPLRYTSSMGHVSKS